MKFKGQVSGEVIVAVFVMLIFLVIVILNNSNTNDIRMGIDSTYKQKNTCLEVMRTISKVYATGDGTITHLDIDHNVKIYADQKAVNTGDEYCYFLARTNDYSLNAGKIRLTNQEGVIIIEQVS